MKNNVNRTLAVKKNIKFIVLAVLGSMLCSMSYAQTGSYSTRTISSDGKSSTWTFNVVSGSAKTIPDNTEDNGILFVNGGGTNKAQTSNYISFNKSEFYIEVPAGSAGNISMTVSSSSDSRWFQLYINTTAGTESQRLWSKLGAGTDGKRGPQSFNFTSSDITTKNSKTYLYFKTNGTEMKVSSFTITLTTGSYTGTALPSSDATLSALTYNGTSVPNFSANQTSYEVELPAGTTAVPTVAATTNESHATTAVTQANAIPGTASVVVRAQDGTTTKTYTINFSVASNLPKVTSATWPNIQGTAVIDNISTTKTITGQVKNGTGLTAITPTFTGNNINTWTPQGPQDFSNGAVEYIISGNGPVEYYYVTITEAAPMSSDATLKSLTYGGTSVPNFSASTYVYNIELTNGIKTPPTIGAVANDTKANVSITQAESVPGSGTVVVTAEDGSQLTYTVNYTVAVPQSSLTTHVPEVYEAKEIAGGYGGSLSVFDGREYETYYASFLESGALSVTVVPVQKSAGITTSISDYHCKATDGWMEMETTTSKSNYTMTATDEFAAGSSAVHKLLNNAYYEMHVQGFDQFSFFGKDNNADASKGKHFEVYVDNIQQPMTLASSATIRRFDITTGEHIIKVVGVGASNNEFYGFSLRIAQEPRTKWLKGNDSTQVVMQTTAPKPVYYFTKYNSMGETRLEWDGPVATGITLNTYAQGPIGDTLVLSGIANCPVGTYTYKVASYYNGVETSSVNGAIKVASDIQATSDINMDVYQGEEMDQITFKYYALSANDIQLTWPNGQPQGISGSDVNGKYVIGGTPTTTGTFPYSITVTGADTVIQGHITVNTLNYGDNSVLYLYKNNLSYENDEVYRYIKSTNKWNLIPRKAKEDGLRPANQYANYKWVLISEDVDADKEEVLGIIHGGANLPVLNLKGFTYSSGRLGWGEPDNGAIDSTENSKVSGCYLHVQHAEHPIFQHKMSYLKNGDSIKVLSNYAHNGLMPIDVRLQGTLCLGTAYTRDIDNYYGSGELQTVLHEVPASMSGNKYVCLPMARNVTLSEQGQRLIDGIINYLSTNTPSGVTLPSLQINEFAIGEYKADINQANNTILLTIPQEEYDNLENAQPVITLDSPTNTHIIPSVEPFIDLRYAVYIPHTFVVTDYINRRAYSVSVELYDPQQGIEEVYSVGQWVNIFDIYGRKVATTNEDIYAMELPQGMYIVITEDGHTIKIMK